MVSDRCDAETDPFNFLFYTDDNIDIHSSPACDLANAPTHHQSDGERSLTKKNRISVH